MELCLYILKSSNYFQKAQTGTTGKRAWFYFCCLVRAIHTPKFWYRIVASSIVASKTIATCGRTLGPVTVV